MCATNAFAHQVMRSELRKHALARFVPALWLSLQRRNLLWRADYDQSVARLQKRVSGRMVNNCPVGTAQQDDGNR
jgi:hypothetical protein